MKPEAILVRFGELMLKGRNRGRFERVIRQQIAAALLPIGIPNMRYEYGRLFIQLDEMPYEAVAGKLSHIFGILSFSPVAKALLIPEQIREVAYTMFSNLKRQPGSFKISTKRAWKQFEMDTQQLNTYVGGYILSRTADLKVDVHQPEVELRIEIREDAAYLFVEVIQAAGGFPYGTNGKAMLLLSGGIDSPVAGHLSMRKGLAIEAIHFHSYPFTSERAQHKVKKLTQVLAKYAPNGIKLHMVPFTEIQTALAGCGQPELTITLMRRAMLRISVKLAERSGALVLLTGESLGQVASQTLPSLQTIEQAIEMPILRPLIMADKDDITRMAETIGTYSISIEPYEDCCTLFMPKSPSTNPNLRILIQTEQKLADLAQWLDEAADNTETVWITHDSLPDATDYLF